MSEPSLRQGTNADHDHAGNEQARGAPGKRARTDSLPARRAEATKVAVEHIAKGVHDENTLTNEVFWWLEPDLPHDHLKAGSEEATEWLQVRDDVVRPALAHAKPDAHDAKPDAKSDAHEVGGQELAKVVPDARADAGPTHSGDALIDDLLAHVPAHGSPNKLEAAWLLKALGTKLFGAFPMTIDQLTQLSRGETALRTKDGESSGAAIKSGLAELEKQKIHAKQIDATHYEVDGGHLPVLAVMIDLAAGRLREFVRGGMKDRRVLFQFGDMVRADVDYAKDGKHSSHASGNAIDLGMNLKSEADVVSVLSALPAGKISMVFPDGGAGKIPEHVHLALGDDGLYELGISFAPPFFQLSDSIFSRQKAAEEAAGGKDAEEGKVIHADGLVMWHPVWYQSTGVHKGGGKWEWTRKYGGPARPHIKSGALKSLLNKLDSGKARDVSVQAAKEDGVDPHAVAH